jgi:SnoaL-like domain
MILSTAIKEKIMSPIANASAVFEGTRLAHRFCCLADQMDAAGVASLFTPNGKFERGELRVESRADIEKMTASRPAGMVTRHLLTTSVVEPIGDDAAEGRHYCLVYVSGAGQSSDRPIVREYQDRYRLTPEGWRIESRLVLTPFAG